RRRHTRSKRDWSSDVCSSDLLFICATIMYELNRLYEREKLDYRIVWTIVIISLLNVTNMKIASIYTDQLNQLFFIVPAATGVLRSEERRVGKESRCKR